MNVTIAVALIAGGSGIISAIFSGILAGKSASSGVLAELKTQQAIQNERMDAYQRQTNEKIEAYQRQTNEKIDELRHSNQAQQEWGTRIALLENDMRQIKGGELK